MVEFRELLGGHVDGDLLRIAIQVGDLAERLKGNTMGLGLGRHGGVDDGVDDGGKEEYEEKMKQTRSDEEL